MVHALGPERGLSGGDTEDRGDTHINRMLQSVVLKHVFEERGKMEKETDTHNGMCVCVYMCIFV